MKISKLIIAALCVFVFLETQSAITNTGELNMNVTASDFEKVVIYYLPLDFLTEPVSASQIKDSCFYKIEIKADIIPNLNSFVNQISNLSFKKEKSKRSDFRIYYELYDRNENILLSIGLDGYGGDGLMSINGNRYRNQKLFYEFIMPFVPIKEHKSFVNFLKVGKF